MLADQQELAALWDTKPMARLVVGVNDLATTHPDLAAELVDQTLATQLSAGSQRKVEWCCAAEGHIWSAIVGNRTSKGSGCPYCSGHLAIIGETDLATLRPDLAAELVRHVRRDWEEEGGGRAVKFEAQPVGIDVMLGRHGETDAELLAVEFRCDAERAFGVRGNRCEQPK